MSNGGIQPNLRLRKDFPVGVIFKLRFEGQNIWTGLLKIKKRVFFFSQRTDLGKIDAFRELKGCQGGRSAAIEIIRG